MTAYPPDHFSSRSAEDYYARLRGALIDGPPPGLADFIDELYACADRGGVIFSLGNGASASLATHMACDLTKNTAADLGLPPHVMPGRRIRALSLTENTSTLTAYGNDLSFDLAFVEQLKNLLEPRDLVVAVSASGASRNILLALEYAHVAGARTVVLTGMMPSAEHAVARCDVAVRVPATKIDMIEDLHLPVLHVAIRMLTERLHACPPPRDRDNGHGSAPVKTHNG